MKEHVSCSERRLRIWNLNELTLERTIQNCLSKFDMPKVKESISRSFSNLTFAGKTKAALDLLSHSEKGGILHLDDGSDPTDHDSPSVRDILIS